MSRSSWSRDETSGVRASSRLGKEAETEYLLILSRDLGCIDVQATGFLRRETEEISRMLNALREKVEASQQG